MSRTPQILSTHETEICRGIIQLLERRDGALHSDLIIRDKGSNTPPEARVEMTFRLNNQLYAIEHTVIEPFNGFLAHQNRAADRFVPLEKAISDALIPMLADGASIELHLPHDALTELKLVELRKAHSVLTEWVCRNAMTLTPKSYADYKGSSLKAQPDGVAFTVSLHRFDGISARMPRFQIMHLPPSSTESRATRLERACAKKFPKLNAWKRSDHARTILVFEGNDIQLTNPTIVAETFLPIARARDDRPDETYLVSTCHEPWSMWPILIKDQCYFDFATGHHPFYFEMSTTGDLLPSE
jgi:hypothetical protein